MAERELFDDLIGTYRDLNIRVRPLPEERLNLKGGTGTSVRQAVTRLRDDELHFSQIVKEAISGVGMAEAVAEKEADPIVGTESELDTTVVILSQFGTARESTLAMLRGLSAEDWDRVTVDGSKSIRNRLREHIEQDRQQMEQIVSLLGSP